MRVELLVVLAALYGATALGDDAVIDDVQLAAVARTAETVVVGVCDAGQSSWVQPDLVGPPLIVTRHQCRVEQTLAGPAGETITIQVLGGTVGQVAMRASGSVTVPTAPAVLFVQPSAFGDYHVLTGGAAGVLPVDSRRAVAAGMPLERLTRWVRQVRAR